MSFKRYLISRYFWLNLFVSTIVLAALFLLLYFLVAGFTRHSAKATVPNFIGLKITSLDKFVDDTEVDYRIVDSVYNVDFPRGVVLEQSPAPAAITKPGRIVYLIVNAISPKKVNVPNLMSLSHMEAKIRLEAYGLKLGAIRYEVGLPVVLEQSINGKPYKPDAVMQIIQGTAVDIVVGKGEDVDKIITPDLFRMNATQLMTVLEGNSLDKGLEFWDPGTDKANAIVYKQAPQANGVWTIKPGDMIDVWYCNADDPKLETIALEREEQKKAIEEALIEQKNPHTETIEDDNKPKPRPKPKPAAITPVLTPSTP